MTEMNTEKFNEVINYLLKLARNGESMVRDTVPVICREIVYRQVLQNSLILAVSIVIMFFLVKAWYWFFAEVERTEDNKNPVDNGEGTVFGFLVIFTFIDCLIIGGALYYLLYTLICPNLVVLEYLKDLIIK